MEPQGKPPKKTSLEINRFDTWLPAPKPKPGFGKRAVYVTDLQAEERTRLEDLGYEVVDVRTLSRETGDDIAFAIECWLQGMSEGSIAANAEKRKNLELEAKLHGLLVNRSMRVEGSIQLDGATLEQLLDFGPSRYTVKHVSRAEIEDAKRAAIIPGYKPNSDKEDN